MRVRKISEKYSLLYLVSVVVVAYVIKYWYSNASMDEMQWMMLPLVQLLDLFLSGEFEPQVNGEWIHVGLQILLVKGCSGINFFIMSFVAYALVFKKVNHQILCNLDNESFVGMGYQEIGKIIVALLAAWLTTLMANAARIMLALFLFENPSLVQLLGLADDSAHRLAGLIVFLPALFWQMQIGRHFTLSKSYVVVAGLMIALLVVVPLLTANALNHPEEFIKHSTWLITMLGVGGIIVFVFGSKIVSRNNACVASTG